MACKSCEEKRKRGLKARHQFRAGTKTIDPTTKIDATKSKAYVEARNRIKANK